MLGCPKKQNPQPTYKHAYKWVEGSAFWDSPTLEIPKTKENEEALKLYKEGKGKQRQGV